MPFPKEFNENTTSRASTLTWGLVVVANTLIAMVRSLIHMLSTSTLLLVDLFINMLCSVTF